MLFQPPDFQHLTTQLVRTECHYTKVTNSEPTALSTKQLMVDGNGRFSRPLKFRINGTWIKQVMKPF